MKAAGIIKKPIEMVGGDIKKAAWSSSFESIAILILGILFIAFPDVMNQVITYIFGAFFIIKGAFRIINYFVEQGQRDFFNNSLLIGTISALIGIAILVIGWENIANVFRIVVGVFMIYESLVRINTAIKLHAAGVGIWKYILILALVILALGSIVVFNDVTTIIGWVMIVAGLIGIVSDFMFIQQINNVINNLTKK